MPPQVDELAANHDGRQAVERPHRFGTHLAQSVEQTEEGALKDVVGLLPAAQLGEAMEHAAGEHFEAQGDAAQQLVGRAHVAAFHAGEPVVELSRARRLPRRFTHDGPRATCQAAGTNTAAMRGDDTRVSRAGEENGNAFSEWLSCSGRSVRSLMLEASLLAEQRRPRCPAEVEQASHRAARECHLFRNRRSFRGLLPHEDQAREHLRQE